MTTYIYQYLTQQLLEELKLDVKKTRISNYLYELQNTSREWSSFILRKDDAIFDRFNFWHYNV